MKKFIYFIGVLGFIILLIGASAIDSNSMDLSNGIFISLLGLAAIWASVKTLSMVE